MIFLHSNFLVVPVCLPKPEKDPPIGLPVMASGWGMFENNSGNLSWTLNQNYFTCVTYVTNCIICI